MFMLQINAYNSTVTHARITLNILSQCIHFSLKNFVAKAKNKNHKRFELVRGAASCAPQYKLLETVRGKDVLETMANIRI